RPRERRPTAITRAAAPTPRLRRSASFGAPVSARRPDRRGPARGRARSFDDDRAPRALRRGARGPAFSHARLRTAGTRRPYFRIRVPSLSYSTEMLDVSAKRVRLHESLRLSPGRIGDAIQAASDTAERAAAGIWRREPSVWSTDPAVQQKIANRLGW